MGPTSISFILAIQHAVIRGQRGVATGAATFTRTIGGALGVGLLGAALAWGLGMRLANAKMRGGIDVTGRRCARDTHQSAPSPERGHAEPRRASSLVQTNLAVMLSRRLRS